jgi:glucose-1-phosphate thymidylyltransferase
MSLKIKGIVLAGGMGTRMKPLSTIISKHLMPVYDKPMIFYSLSVLIYSGIKNILIITDLEQQKYYKKILYLVEKKHKLNLHFEIQNNPIGGIAESFIIGKKFLNDVDKVCLILGDNFIYGRGFPRDLSRVLKNKNNNRKANIFLSEVKNPNQYGIAYLNKDKKIEKIIEKPKNNKSNLAVTGLYIFPKDVIHKVKKVKRSARGELEITSLNNIYLKEKRLNYSILGRGITWFDMGTYENMFQCAEFVRLIDRKQAFKISDI